MGVGHIARDKAAVVENKERWVEDIARYIGRCKADTGQHSLECQSGRCIEDEQRRIGESNQC